MKNHEFDVLKPRGNRSKAVGELSIGGWVDTSRLQAIVGFTARSSVPGTLPCSCLCAKPRMVRMLEASRRPGRSQPHHVRRPLRPTRGRAHLPLKGH